MFASNNLSTSVLILQFALYFLPIFAIIGFIIFVYRRQTPNKIDEQYPEPDMQEETPPS